MKIISTLILLFVAQNAIAALPPTYREGQMTFSVYSEYFSSTAIYDRFSNTFQLPNNQFYNNLTTSFDAKFDMPENFVLGGGINAAYASSHGEVLFFNGLYKNRTNSEITDAHALAQYFIDYERFRLVPELKGSVTFKHIGLLDSTNDQVLTNDYADTATVGAWAVVNFGRLRGYGYIGAEYQDDDRASEMPWQVGLLWRSHNFLLAGSFDGFQPIINDKDTLGYPRENRTFFVDGQSLRYYSTNPALTEVRFTGGFAFENNVQIIAGWGTTIMGTETAQGYTAFAGVSFGVDMASGPAVSFERTDHKKHRSSSVGNSPSDGRRTHHQGGNNATKDEGAAPEFQPDLEEYDESLFD